MNMFLRRIYTKKIFLFFGLLMFVISLYKLWSIDSTYYTPESKSPAELIERSLVVKSSEEILSDNIMLPVSDEEGPSGNTTSIVKYWRHLTDGETSKLSVLGRILFLNEEHPKLNTPDKEYQILMWKYGKAIENRHLKNYGSNFIDPFESCSVHNCKITYNAEDLHTADIVIFHMHRMQPKDLPEERTLNGQIWAFLTDESPYHTFMHNNKLSNYNGVFNWSMTYRMDSDIPVPYGRTVQRNPFNPKTDAGFPNKRRDVLVAILGSNCGGRNNRWAYVKELQKHMAVDVYGGCGTLKTCPGHFKSNCHDIDDYIFYLAFENSNCDEYITEKLWWNAYGKNSIPIVMGANRDSYKKLLPPNSYLNVDDYAHPKDLATHLLHLNKSGQYQEYYQWKDNYEILNEHGYFQSKSKHYCRICEALNYNEKSQKIYNDLNKFWSVEENCYSAWNN